MKPEFFGDSYVRKARLYPALIISAPYALVVWLLSSYVFQEVINNLTVAGIVSLPIAFIFAEFSRDFGKKAEPGLYAAWGGVPTTALLRRTDNSIDRVTKDRYIAYLKTHVAKWRPPTKRVEHDNPLEADLIYASAINWLRDNRRGNQYTIVQAETASYGFRRNLFGLRFFGEIGCLVGVAILFIDSLLLNDLGLIDQWRQCVLILALSGIFLILEIFFAEVLKSEWVKKAAYGYAYALLATCDLNEPD